MRKSCVIVPQNVNNKNKKCIRDTNKSITMDLKMTDSLKYIEILNLISSFQNSHIEYDGIPHSHFSSTSRNVRASSKRKKKYREIKSIDHHSVSNVNVELKLNVSMCVCVFVYLLLYTVGNCKLIGSLFFLTHFSNIHGHTHSDTYYSLYIRLWCAYFSTHQYTEHNVLCCVERTKKARSNNSK